MVGAYTATGYLGTRRPEEMKGPLVLIGSEEVFLLYTAAGYLVY